MLAYTIASSVDMNNGKNYVEGCLNAAECRSIFEMILTTMNQNQHYDMMDVDNQYESIICGRNQYGMQLVITNYGKCLSTRICSEGTYKGQPASAPFLLQSSVKVKHYNRYFLNDMTQKYPVHSVKPAAVPVFFTCLNGKEVKAKLYH